MTNYPHINQYHKQLNNFISSYYRNLKKIKTEKYKSAQFKFPNCYVCLQRQHMKDQRKGNSDYESEASHIKEKNAICWPNWAKFDFSRKTMVQTLFSFHLPHFLAQQTENQIKRNEEESAALPESVGNPRGRDLQVLGGRRIGGCDFFDRGLY